MKIDGNAVRAGMVIEYENKLWQVVKHELRTPGNLRAFNQVELKELQNGTKNNVRLSSTERVERVRLDQHDCNFLYAEGDMLTFMNTETYEQFTLPADLLGDDLPFLQDGMTVIVELHENTPIGITLPEKVELTIAETEPVVRGQTAASSNKPAVLENGVRIMVPPFIDSGERVIVRIEDRAYVERAK